MNELIAEFQAAPLWAQIGMVFFAFTFVVMLVEPRITNRKFRRHFDEIVRALGQPPTTSREWPFNAPMAISGRPFELRYDLRRTGKGSSYRGPTGHLLIGVTRLAGTRWPMHQVDIATVDNWLSRLVSSKRATGDPDFDGRFMVREDGLPVRDGWLDQAMRREIAIFFDAVKLPGPIWIREGELQFIIQDPWKGLDGPAVRAVLERQATLATALDRTDPTARFQELVS